MCFRKLWAGLTIENFLRGLTIIVPLLIGGFLLFWLYLSLWQTHQAISRRTILLPDEAGTITYPDYLLLFSPPSPLFIDWSDPTSINEISLEFTKTVRVTASNVVTDVVPTKFNFAPSESSFSTRLLLENVGAELKEQEVTIVVQVNKGNIVTLTPTLEGVSWAKTRQFVTGTINEKSPLILGALALVAFFRIILDYQDRWRKEQEDKERVSKATTKALVSDLCKFWREGNLKDAEKIWQALLSDSATQMRIEPGIQQLAYTTEKLLKGQDDATTIRQLVDENGDSLLPELTGVLIYVGNVRRRNPQFLLPSDFMELKAFFPWKKLTDGTQRGDLWRILKALDPSDFQNWTLNYPSDIDLPYPDPLHQTGLFDVCNERNPLRYINAQDEQSTLFRVYAYWGKHPNQPIQEWLSKTTASSVVYGVPGCGRTALALALCHQYRTAPRLYRFYPLYLHSQPHLPEIKKGVARYLLDYIGQKPTLALDFSEAVRVQFVCLLRQGLTQAELKAQIEKYRSQTDEWLADATDDQRSIWQEAGITQLELLYETLNKVEADDRSFEHETWVNALVQCVQAWGFSGIRLVVDSILIDNPEEVISDLQRWLFPWYHSGMIVTLFLPVAETEINKVQQKLRWLHIPELHFSWSSEELKALVEHRITKVCQVDDASVRREQCFDQEGTYNEFINAAAGKPQKLVELWNECLRQLGEAPKITRDIVRQASNRL